MRNTISKKKLISLTKYQLFTNYVHIIINVAVIVLNIIIAIILRYTVGGEAGAGSLDATYLIWVLMIGITFFAPSFKFALVNGASRKTYYLSGAITAISFALALGIITGLFILLAESIATTFTIFTMLYGKNILGMFVWLFAAGIFMGMLGWFIACVFYRTYKKERLIILAALLIIPALLVLINYFTDGVLGASIIRFFMDIMGFGKAIPNPYIASASFVAMGALLCGAVYLLVRRASIRE